MANIAPRLKLAQYFVLESNNAFAGILFLYCSFFWTQRKFGYSDTANLLLTAAHGLVYMVITVYGGKLADRIGYDRMLSISALGLACTLLLGWIPTWWITPFLVIVIYTLFIGPSWPTLEAAILHCPGQASMPSRLGLYNITWAFGDSLGFALSALLFAWNPDSILWIPGILFGFQWVWLKIGPANDGSEGDAAMEMPHRGNDVARPVKRQFMHTAWLANGLGFLMLAGFFALAPFVGRHLNLEPKHTIWLVSTLLFARTGAFLIFWKWESWHYHMGWSQLALWAAPASLAMAFFSTRKEIVFASLAVFGMAVGLSYSASLYYSLDYGENKGEHGGLHESILGVGMFSGPLLAAGVSALGGGSTGAQWTLVALAILLAFLGLWVIHPKNEELRMEN